MASGGVRHIAALAAWVFPLEDGAMTSADGADSGESLDLARIISPSARKLWSNYEGVPDIEAVVRCLLETPPTDLVETETNAPPLRKTRVEGSFEGRKFCLLGFRFRDFETYKIRWDTILQVFPLEARKGEKS